MNEDRYDRNTRLFGLDGQRKLRDASVAIVGVGLGSHVAQQLALLGVGAIALIDKEELSHNNRNRYVGARDTDPIPGSKKVDIARRLIVDINAAVRTIEVAQDLCSQAAFDAVKSATHVFGCLDDDGPRFVLNDLTTAFAIPYIDLATDVVAGEFGGRVFVNWTGAACLFCVGELNQTAIQEYLESSDDRINRESIYGIRHSDLGEAGPSVVSVNGVVASLAVTEFMSGATGIARPKTFLNYRGNQSRVLVRECNGRADCPYCRQWGHGNSTDPDRYFRHR